MSYLPTRASTKRTATTKKTFGNTKQSGDAHYPRHGNVGAYECLFFDYKGEVDALDVSAVVCHHMDPFSWEKEKKPRAWSEELYLRVAKLHEADKQCSKEKEDLTK